MTLPVRAWHKRCSEEELSKVTIEPDCPRCGSDNQRHIGSYIQGSVDNGIETVFYQCSECGHTHHVQDLVSDRI